MEFDSGVTTCWEGVESDYLRGLPRLTLRARDLLGLACLRGGGQPPQMPPDLPEIYQQIVVHPDTLLTLTSAFDCRGGPYQFPKDDNAYQRRLDLHLLQRLQLVPGDTRSARELLRRLKTAVPSLDGLCVFDRPTGNWPNWPEEAVAAYERGLQLPLPDPQTAEEAAAAKIASVAEIAAAGRLYLRAHHLMCMMCHYGRAGAGPLQVDNLWEPLEKIKQNPDIDITLVEGDCMVCPACHYGYEPRSGACVAACGLRDRRKDLDVLQLLDLLPGATMKARDLYRLYLERIPRATVICYYVEPEATIPEWGPCTTADSGVYEQGLARLAGELRLTGGAEL